MKIGKQANNIYPKITNGIYVYPNYFNIKNSELEYIIAIIGIIN